jgi:hypothetical protein
MSEGKSRKRRNGCFLGGVESVDGLGNSIVGLGLCSDLLPLQPCPATRSIQSLYKQTAIGRSTATLSLYFKVALFASSNSIAVNYQLTAYRSRTKVCSTLSLFLIVFLPEQSGRGIMDLVFRTSFWIRPCPITWSTSAFCVPSRRPDGRRLWCTPLQSYTSLILPSHTSSRRAASPSS